MENTDISFIGYQNQNFFTKIEMGVDEEHELPFVRNHNDDREEFNFENVSQNIFSGHNKSNDLFYNIFDASFSFEKPTKHPPFKIIRQEKSVKEEEEQSISEENSATVPTIDRISDKSRRIIKREKAKQRSLAKNPLLALTSNPSEIPEKYIPQGFDQPNLDDKSKKKMIQMVRNRLSAQNSRDKKKAYLQKLEMHQKKMAAENIQYQKEIRQLKQANEALKLECEYLRRCLKSAPNENQDKLYQSEVALKESISELNLKQDIELGADTKAGPYIRKNYNSGQLIKYSLGLATVFAVLMFSNVDIQNERIAPGFLQLGQHSDNFQSHLKEGIFANLTIDINKVYLDLFIQRRTLLDSPIEVPQYLKGSNLKAKIEQEASNSYENPKIVNYPTFDESKISRNIFHENNMKKSTSRLELNASENMEVPSNISFPQFLNKSTKEHRTMNPADSTTYSNAKRENYSALFCPSGFAIHAYEKEKSSDDLSIKLEEQIPNDSRRETKNKNSEWLQLIVPKSNLLPTDVEDHEGLKTNTDKECENEDTSLIELWCKIVNVRTLHSGL